MKKNFLFLLVFFSSLSFLQSKTITLPEKSNVSLTRKALLLMDFKTLESLEFPDKKLFNQGDLLQFILSIVNSHNKNYFLKERLKKILKLIQFMIENGADLNAKASDSRTPLHLACKNGYTEIVKVLLKNGADLNPKTSSSYTPLHLACKNGYTEIVKVLLKNGADLNAKTYPFSYTPLHLACKNGYTEIVKVLLKNGADLTPKTSSTPYSTPYSSPYSSYRNYTPLKFACFVIKDVEMAELLCSYGAFIIDGVAQEFKKAMKKGYDKYLNKILKIKESFQKEEALKKAIKEKSLDKIRKLIEDKVDVNFIYSDGNTPLHFAVVSKNFDVVKILIENEADLKLKNKDGKTALDLSLELANIESKDLNIFLKISTYLLKNQS